MVTARDLGSLAVPRTATHLHSLQLKDGTYKLVFTVGSFSFFKAKFKINCCFYWSHLNQSTQSLEPVRQPVTSDLDRWA